MSKRKIIQEIIDLLKHNGNKHSFNSKRVCHPTFSTYNNIHKTRTWSIDEIRLLDDNTILSVCGYSFGPFLHDKTFSFMELQTLKNFMEEDLSSLING